MQLGQVRTGCIVSARVGMHICQSLQGYCVRTDLSLLLPGSFDEYLKTCMTVPKQTFITVPNESASIISDRCHCSYIITKTCPCNIQIFLKL